MKGKFDFKKVAGVFLFLTLIFSIVYSVAMIVVSSNGSAGEKGALRSDYVLMLLQCLLGLFVIGLPSFLERKLRFDIPNYMTVLFFIFLYCAIYLGEVRNFYYLIPQWDTILHAFSGAMLGAFGFSLVSILNDSEKVKVALSPLFLCVFAFCFALAAGALWEIYEFSGDFLFGLNMQKFRTADGEILIGQAALSDTMKDLIIDSVGALIIVIIGYLAMLKRKMK